MELQKSLENNRFVVTSEIQPPLDMETGELLKHIEKIRGRLDGVTVPELELEGVVADYVGTCRLLKENNFDPILQTACRRKNRLDIQSQLLEAAEEGVKNVLAFTADYRITGDSLQEMMFFHVDSEKLFSVVESLSDSRDVAGRQVERSTRFFVGSGVGWCAGRNVPDLALREMEEMVRQGTGFFLSTPVFDLDVFYTFMKRIAPFGIPVIAEVILVRTAGMAQFINSHVQPGLVPGHIIQKLAGSPEKEKTSIEIFTDIVSGLKEVCQGVHIIPVGHEGSIPKFLDAVRL